MKSTRERWKRYGDHCEVSSCGRVRSEEYTGLDGGKRKSRLLKGNDAGYAMVFSIIIAGVPVKVPLPRLVAECFIHKPPGHRGYCVRDNNYKNVSLDNLYWLPAGCIDCGGTADRGKARCIDCEIRNRTIAVDGSEPLMTCYKCGLLREAEFFGTLLGGERYSGKCLWCGSPGSFMRFVKKYEKEALQKLGLKKCKSCKRNKLLESFKRHHLSCKACVNKVAYAIIKSKPSTPRPEKLVLLVCSNCGEEKLSNHFGWDTKGGHFKKRCTSAECFSRGPQTKRGTVMLADGYLNKLLRRDNIKTNKENRSIRRKRIVAHRLARDNLRCIHCFEKIPAADRYRVSLRNATCVCKPCFYNARKDSLSVARIRGKESSQIRRKDSIAALSDSYIKNLINRDTDLGFSEIPQDLIEIKRVQLTIYRGENEDINRS